MTTIAAPAFAATVPLSTGWNKIRGIRTDGHTVTVDPQEYFFRYESPEWLVCDWEGVERDLLPLVEDSQTTLEQKVLEYVRAHGRKTCDPVEVLEIAWKVNSYTFRDEYASHPDLATVNPAFFGMLREMGTIMALNRVLETGHIANVGPAWFFGIAAEKVFDLTPEEGERLDDLYHGTFFNETRRLEALKANAALGGRLVHGCHSSPSMSGGCIVPFGGDMSVFTEELKSFRAEWIDAVRA